jgi:hypothetical protein
MYESAVLHARVTSPFSSEVTTLIDVPGALIATPNASASQSESIRDSSHQSTSISSQPLHADKDGSMGPERSGSEALKIKPNEIDPPPITFSEQKSIDLPIREPSDLNQIRNSKQANPEPVLPNDSNTKAQSEYSIPREELPQTAKKFQIWFGDLSRSDFDARYLSFRDRLADFAYWGNFEEVFQVLTDIDKAYGQSWVNAPRLSSPLNHHIPQ